MSSNWVGCHFDTVQGIKGIPRLARAINLERGERLRGTTRAEPSRAEPRRRNRGGERHDGGATTGSIIEKNGFSNASQLEEEMEEEKEEAYGDDLLRQLRRRTSFRWIGEEPWRDNEGTVASFEGCCSLPR